MIRRPATDKQWATDEIHPVNIDYWYRLSILTIISIIHFKDYPQLAEFDCSDPSYPDAWDAPELTHWLAAIIKEPLSVD